MLIDDEVPFPNFPPAPPLTLAERIARDAETERRLCLDLRARGYTPQAVNKAIAAERERRSWRHPVVH
jgi:hypothetical protein